MGRMTDKVWAFPGTRSRGGKHRIQHGEGVELGSELRKRQEGGRAHGEAGKAGGLSV